MKYSVPFLVMAETALYFGFCLLFPPLSDAFPAMLVFLGLVSVSLFFAEMLEKIPVLRTLLLFLPALSVFLMPDVSLWTLSFVPPFLYAFLTAAAGRFHREYWRYVRVSRFLFGASVILTVISLVNTPTLVRPLILAGVFFLFCVTGLRKLRTEARGSFSWRAFNFAEVFLPLSAAGLLTAGIVFGLSKLKRVFEILMTPFAYLLSWVSQALAWLFSHTKIAAEIEQESASIPETALETTGAAAAEATVPPEAFHPNLPSVEINWRIVLAVLFILVTALILILIFRHRPEAVKKPGDSMTGGKAFRASKKRRRQREHPESSVERIRSIYREYLSLLSLRGLQRSPGDTSLDILQFAKEGEEDEGGARLRELYLKARYLGKAEKNEAAEAERIFEHLKNRT